MTSCLLTLVRQAGQKLRCGTQFLQTTCWQVIITGFNIDWMIFIDYNFFIPELSQRYYNKLNIRIRSRAAHSPPLLNFLYRIILRFFWGWSFSQNFPCNSVFSSLSSSSCSSNDSIFASTRFKSLWIQIDIQLIYLLQSNHISRLKKLLFNNLLFYMKLNPFLKTFIWKVTSWGLNEWAYFLS